MISLFYPRQLINYLRVILEYSVYAQCFFLFFDTFSTFKAISIFNIIFSSLILFFIEGKYKKLQNPIIILYFFIFISILMSCFFSIDPQYSFSFIRKDFGKAFFVFLAISFFFDVNMIKRLFCVFTLAISIYLLSGLYSYINYNLDFFTSQTFLINSNQNEYACYLGFVFPLIISIFFLFSDNYYLRFAIFLLIIFSFTAIILSGTRGAMGSALATILIFAFFLMKDFRNKNLGKYVKNILIYFFSMILIALVTITLLWQKPLIDHIGNTIGHLPTFDNRLNFFWLPAIEATKKRPIFGWGYGNKIYRKEEIFKNNRLKPNYSLKGGLHNTFITILFHQGFFGLTIYIVLVIICIYYLSNLSFASVFPEKVLFIGLLCTFVGSISINAFVISISYLNTAPFFGLAAAMVNHKDNITGEN